MRYLYIIISIFIAFSCTEKKQEKEMTPWGTVVGESEEQKPDSGDVLSLEDIVEQGEMIALTLNGPKSYYDYHGHGMGVQFMLAEKLAQKIGVKLRIEVCADTTELVKRLQAGDGDLIAYPIHSGELTACGPDWAVSNENTTLAKEIKAWYKPEMMDEMAKLEKQLIASGGVVRHVYSPFMNRQKGVISKWDPLFQKYAPTARLDWKLLAAQCYQESCFDPKAHSWAGACGLMQIMPGTAKELGLPQENIYSPEANIAAAARYMNMLMNEFKDAATHQDRICFALAAYNGGKLHVRDAMALAQKNGKSPSHWRTVQEYILNLQQPAFYRDPVVKYGYMRGSETSAYVDRIIQRWREYGGRPGILTSPAMGGYMGPSTQPHSIGSAAPRPAKRKNRFAN